MTDYFCRGRVKLGFILMLLVSGGSTVAFFLMPVLSAGGFPAIFRRMVTMLPLGLLFGGAACVGLLRLLYSFTVYRLDENGIVKRRWNGSTQQFAWKDLVRVEAPQGGRIRLTDFRGIRISEPPPDFRYVDKAGRSLREALETQIASLPEELKTQIARPGEFRFGWDAPVIAACFMGLLCVILAFTMPLMPHSGPAAPLAMTLGISCVFLFGSLFMAHLGLRQATRVLTLTETSLIDRSLFGRREILFDQVVSVTRKDVTGKSGTIESITVKSAADTISVPSLLPNYARFVEAVQARVSAQVAQNTPQAIVTEARNDLRKNVIGMFVIGCVFGLGLFGLGTMVRQTAQDVLKRQTELDAYGVRAQGKVADTVESGRSSRPYYLNYTFQVGGKHYSHSSSISRETYERVHVGSVARITYLPRDPEISRVAQSSAREDAEGKMGAAKWMFGVACTFPFLFGALGLLQRPRYHTPSVPKSIS